MNRLEVLNDLNEFAITNDNSKIIYDLNKLLLEPVKNEDLIMLIMNNAQLFGFDC